MTNETHECDGIFCAPTPTQQAAMNEQAKENSRQLLRAATARYPSMTVHELANLFGWSVEATQQVASTEAG